MITEGQKKSKILGIVGKKNGYLALKGDCVIKIPFINQKFLTPFSEAMQGVIWHYLVSHQDSRSEKKQNGSLVFKSEK